MANFNSDVSYTSKPDLIIGDGVQTENVKPTADTAYKRGDLLVVGTGNVATHSSTAADWHVVCAADVSVAQANAGYEIPVYTQGEISVHAVTLNGVALTTAQKNTARQRANQATAIELRKVAGETY